MEITHVVPTTSQSGDSVALQPAAPLSPQVRAALFDEFTEQPLTTASSSSSGAFWTGLVSAVVLAGIVVYIIKNVRPYEETPAHDTHE